MAADPSYVIVGKLRVKIPLGCSSDCDIRPFRVLPRPMPSQPADSESASAPGPDTLDRPATWGIQRAFVGTLGGLSRLNDEVLSSER